MSTSWLPQSPIIFTQPTEMNILIIFTLFIFLAKNTFHLVLCRIYQWVEPDIQNIWSTWDDRIPLQPGPNCRTSTHRTCHTYQEQPGNIQKHGWKQKHLSFHKYWNADSLSMLHTKQHLTFSVLFHLKAVYLSVLFAVFFVLYNVKLSNQPELEKLS